MGKGYLHGSIDEVLRRRKGRAGATKRGTTYTGEIIMSEDKVRVTETTKEYELPAENLVPVAAEDEPTWYNKTSGVLDKFRVIPRLIMLSYIYAFYSSTVWFMALPNPTNAQAAFISTIVGAGAAFFGLYVGKPGAALPKGRK